MHKPSLRDDAAYAKADDDVREMESQVRALQTQRDKLIAELQQPDTEPSLTQRARLLISGGTADAIDRGALREHLQLVTDDLRLRQEALRLLLAVRSEQLNRVSTAVCEAKRADHAKLVRQVAQAAAALARASAAEIEFRDGLTAAGFLTATLRPMPFYGIGRLEDRNSRATAYIRECAEYGFETGVELPSEQPDPATAAQAKSARNAARARALRDAKPLAVFRG